MAKRKKRRRRSRQATNHSSTNLHHLLWMRKKWVRHPFAHKLRNHDYMIVKLPAQTIHRKIHEAMREVPVLPEEYCELVLESLDEFLVRGDISLDDKPSPRLAVLISILAGVIGEPELTVNALNKQRVLLTQGGF